MNDFQPYPYQTKVANLLYSGRNVILQAPTGAGKTAAALLPFLHAGKNLGPTEFPKRCIYSVPMRVLANHFEAEYKRLARKNAWENKVSIAIQTGDRPGDRQFEADLIFTTIDQALSSLLAAPYSLSRRQRHLNAGAIIGAYLVFDEYHLFPSHRQGPGALGTTLEMLKLLQGLTPFCLMTATFSHKMLTELADILEAAVVTVDEAALRKIETDPDTGRRKERRFQVMEHPISAEAILARPADRIIAVCNRVGRAQQLYTDLVEAEGSDERIKLLHSRFLPEDRRCIEKQIIREFGPEQAERTPGRFILVATQVIEVGLDISCEVMHTELAPANALIQRAGRCARRRGDQGRVFIYPPPEDSKRPHLPYAEGLCLNTLHTFSQPQYNEEIIQFEQEQEIINTVHNETDQALLDSLRAKTYDTRQSIEAVMMRGETGERSALIRLVDNRTLLIHDEPEQLGNPLACDGFSLFRGSLKGQWDQLAAWAEQKELDWSLKYPLAYEEEDEESGRAEPTYYWKPVYEASQLDLPLPFAVHPALVAYDNKLGFRFDPAGTAFRTEPAPERTMGGGGFYTYELERYEEHISRMIRLYERDLQAHLGYIGRQLEDRLGLKPDAVERAARLVIALHDAGKLDNRWQRWAQNYHRAIDRPLEPDFLVAHTHSQTEEHRTIAKRTRPKRPPHAAEGGAACIQILSQAAVDWASSPQEARTLRRAMLTAIVRHHSPRTDSLSEYELHPAAVASLAAALQAAGLDALPVSVQPWKPVKLPRQLVTSTKQGWATCFLYFVLVRALMLADHGSLAKH